MEVRDVFELRKQGKIEEAYNAIRPMYAAHKGHYTTIAMFWIGVDVMRLRYQQRRSGQWLDRGRKRGRMGQAASPHPHEYR